MASLHYCITRTLEKPLSTRYQKHTAMDSWSPCTIICCLGLRDPGPGAENQVLPATLQSAATEPKSGTTSSSSAPLYMGVV